MYYEIYGNLNSSKTLVFIGGLSQSTLAWTGYLPLLQADYKIVLLDLLFQGQSDSPEKHRTFEEHAADVASLMEALAIENSCVIGISYGGAVLMRLLAQHPARIQKAVIMATFAQKTPLFNALGLAWTNALLSGGYDLMLDVMLPSVLGKTYFENPLIPIDTLKNLRRDARPSSANLLKLMRATSESQNYLEPLKSIKQEVLVLAGEEDLLCTPEMNKAIAQAIPNGKITLIPTVGHTLNLEAIPQTAELIRQFY
ncbi:MAG: alpha/beta fold hydrolase [Cytophagales bacterium]|nr:MAG: alpha/beta fold hydrolase [Cytophagales bacterium]